ADPLPFDEGWRFLRADAPGGEAPEFNDSGWRTLDLPHDWSIEGLPPWQGQEAPELEVATGTWRFQKGDDPAWKADGFDDSRWEEVKLPANWEKHSGYKEDKVYGWY